MSEQKSKIENVDRGEMLNREALEEHFEVADEHRDFTIYNQSLDAATLAKVDSIAPYFNVEDGDVIVDAGSGTGQVAELIARTFPHTRVYGEDLSHEQLEQASDRGSLVRLLHADAREKVFPSGSVKVKYYSTSLHEAESFGGQGSARKAMENTFLELEAGGRVIVRDFAKPENQEPVYMKIISKAGLEKVPEGTVKEDIDYNELSTSALFDRFHQEFRGGNAFDYERVIIDGEEYIKLSPEWAHEFYLRKDYTGNWRSEIEEKYTYWTPEEAKRVLEEIGYVNVQIVPDPNEWILKNRLQGKIGLYKMTDEGLEKTDFPMTHMVVVAEKPEAVFEDAEEQKILPEEVDYKKILNSISVDLEREVVNIGGQEFQIDRESIKIGTKKIILRLKEYPDLVLKFVRGDTRNDHNVFKSMYQIIERQKTLDEFGVPHLNIIDSDKEGPPFRYVIQERAPEGAPSAADLIMQGNLTEEDIKQIAEIVNKFEKSKKWQIDSNPFSWFRITKENGSTQMVYISGKVYRYDEAWEFRKIGLLQWIDSDYVKQGKDFCAAIPTKKDYEEFWQKWQSGGGTIDIWKKYLDIRLQP
ncbi:MAG: methyltransferase domain-containing protein [Candidatus Paceibacterota bacterium]|jgi:ubiquinone/menaquinone biosynthesis C-methylase UbiE